MGIIRDIADHGLEVLKKAAIVTNDAFPTRYSIRTVPSDSSGNEIKVNDSGQLLVVLDGKVVEDNSTSTPLLAGVKFVGEPFETLDYAVYMLTIFSDVASADNGCCVESSSDGVNSWRVEECYTIAANTQKTFSFQTNKRFMRISYTNGSSDQTVMDMQSILKKTNSKPSSHRVSDAISPQDDAELVKSVITALSDNGPFINLTATSDGSLKTANVEDGLSIAKGDVTGTTFIHKFGNAPNFDIIDGFATVWDGANNAAIGGAANYTYSTTADINRVSSSNTGDTFSLEVQGLDANYAPLTQTVTLTGQAPVTFPINFIRVFRMKNRGSVNALGLIYCYTSAATVTVGVPAPSNTIRAIINDGNNQTLMSVYTIPAGKIGYMRDWYASASGAKKTSIHVIHLDARPFGEVFQLKHVASITISGTSYIQHRYEEPEVFTEKTDIELQSNTDEADASVSGGFDIVLVDN